MKNFTLKEYFVFVSEFSICIFKFALLAILLWAIVGLFILIFAKK